MNKAMIAVMVSLLVLVAFGLLAGCRVVSDDAAAAGRPAEADVAVASGGAARLGLVEADAARSGRAAMDSDAAGAGAGDSAALDSAAGQDAAPAAGETAASAVAMDSATSPTLRILSFNVRTWTRDRDADSDVFWRTRMAAMERMIGDLDPDVLCFQEMLFPATRYVPDGYRRIGAVNISHPIFVRKGLKVRDTELALRWQACTVEGVRIINVHSSWDSEITQRTVEQVNARLTGRDVACGDWNVRLAALQNAGLQMESARVLLGVPEDDTFANFTRPLESHGPIDHFFVRGMEPVSYRLVTDSYGCSKMSDHYPLLLDVAK